jgi:hypothetical protein
MLVIQLETVFDARRKYIFEVKLLEISFRSGFFANPCFPCFSSDDIDFGETSLVSYLPRDMAGTQKRSVSTIYRDIYKKTLILCLLLLGVLPMGRLPKVV